MDITFTISGEKELADVLMRIGKDAPLAGGAALYPEGELIVSKAKDLVPVDMGALRASGHVEQPDVTATAATVSMGFGGASASYAEIVHEGAGPAVGHAAWMPPSDALKGWAARHGIPTDRGTLFVLARAIGRRGFKGRKYLEIPFKEAQQGMETRLAGRLEKWLEKHAAR